MSELLDLSKSEGYGVCDDEACQGEQNAGVRFPGRNDIWGERHSKTRPKNKLCEISEQSAICVLLPISKSVAPNSVHRIASSVDIHRFI
ncbi:MAG: hypothetical protein MR272_00875 [Pseudoflavonifractor sp.]|nr:hypothetical protein [Pseudoflavonifractor sp.]MDY3019373.1 hypothetical protein [Oscillospiraceae bacterium]